MVVIDASAVLEILKETPEGGALAQMIGGAGLNAPHMIDLEVLHVLRRWVLRGEMTSQQAADAIETYRSMPITRFPHMPLLDAIWEERHNLTAYDAAYLALSRALDAELVTMDAGLRKIAKRR